METKLERNQTARAIKAVRKILSTNGRGENQAFNIYVLMLSVMFVLLLLLGASVAKADGFTNEEYVNAIYKAEGGKNARYLYGIRSISYKDAKEARRICLNTVRNNRKRYKKYGYRRYPEFIQFLGSRYCPTSGANLSFSEKRLNKHWVKNVRYFLNKNRGEV